jgi:hypothetical protein
VLKHLQDSWESSGVAQCTLNLSTKHEQEQLKTFPYFTSKQDNGTVYYSMFGNLQLPVINYSAPTISSD